MNLYRWGHQPPHVKLWPRCKAMYGLWRWHISTKILQLCCNFNVRFTSKNIYIDVLKVRCSCVVQYIVSLIWKNAHWRTLDFANFRVFFRENCIFHLYVVSIHHIYFSRNNIKNIISSFYVLNILCNYVWSSRRFGKYNITHLFF